MLAGYQDNSVWGRSATDALSTILILLTNLSTTNFQLIHDEIV